MNNEQLQTVDQLRTALRAYKKKHKLSWFKMRCLTDYSGMYGLCKRDSTVENIGMKHYLSIVELLDS